MSYAQWLPKNHLEVLDGHPGRNKSSFSRRYYFPGIFGLVGLGSSLFMMYAMKRPYYSGVPAHVAVVCAFAALGQAFATVREYHYKETEARARYYIETHREHFPDYEMVKLGEILEPWTPCR